MSGVGHLAVLEVERQVYAHLALSSSLKRVMVRSDNGVAQVDMADSLVRVEKVEFAEVEYQHVVAILGNR